jgi:hypothetical protein
MLKHQPHTRWAMLALGVLACMGLVIGGSRLQQAHTAALAASDQVAAELLPAEPAVAPLTFSLEVAAQSLQPGEQTQLNALVQDADGQPLAGELVVFFGAYGEVTPGSAVTDAAGRATATYTAGPLPGQARLVALTGLSTYETTVQVASTAPNEPTPEAQLYLPVVLR